MTDLTEKWKKGELPEGWYWVKDDDGQIKLAEYSVYCIDRETNEAEYDWSCPCDIEQVLAPVPSYDEYMTMKDCAKKEFEAVEKYTKVKELLKECQEIFDECFSPSAKHGELYKKIDEALK